MMRQFQNTFASAVILVSVGCGGGGGATGTDGTGGGDSDIVDFGGSGGMTAQTGGSETGSGGKGSGGKPTSGGAASTGGAATGGVGMGGETSTGGVLATGGAGLGGETASGGESSSGGSSTGGGSGAGCDPGQSGESCAPCASGSYCPGGSSPALPCMSGTFDHDLDPKTECLAWSNCEVGTKAIAGDALTDRTCEVCPFGSFSTSENSESCTAETICGPGTFVALAGTSSSDAVCSACPSGTFQPLAGRFSCETLEECVPGEYVTIEPTSSSNRSCASCPVGTLSNSNNAGSCSSFTECAPGTVQIVAGSSTTEPVCASCSAGEFCEGGTSPKVACGGASFDSDSDPATPCASKTKCLAGNYVVYEGDPESDRECDVCAEGTFSTAENAATCAAWTDCVAGERVSNSPSATTNRTCEACASGTYSSSSNAGSCVAVGSCAAGTEMTKAATSTAPVECAACGVGTYCAGDEEPKVVCASGYFDQDLDSATSCTPKTTCGAGSFIAEEGSTTVDRSCSDCGSGTFSSTVNAPSCTSFQTCGAGTYEQAAGTSSSDRKCSTCSAGTFTSGDNQTSCAPHADCAVGTYVSAQGTTSSNRVCASCGTGTTTFATNAASCENIVPTSFAGGNGHTCVVLSDKTLRCFGANTYGQLGLGHVNAIGDDEAVSSLGAVSVGGDVKQVALGLDHTCVLLEEGSVRCFGRSNYGQLGLSSTASIGDTELPSSVSAVNLGRPATAIAAGANHSCAILDDGSVRCWGRNNYGQLGLGNTTTVGDNEHPSAWNTIQIGESVTALALGVEHTCALTSSGAMRCWGRGNYGQLGLGNNTTIGNDETPSTVAAIALGETVVAIGAGQNHSCAVLASGALRCFGRNNYGQLGLGNTTTIGDNEAVTSVSAVSLGGSAKSVFGGTSHTCALLEGGALRCFGRSNLGQLGYGNTQSVGDNEVPSFVSPVSLGGAATAIATGFDHSCALTTAGLRCYGSGTDGRLGIASTANVGDGEVPSSVAPIAFF